MRNNAKSNYKRSVHKLHFSTFNFQLSTLNSQRGQALVTLIFFAMIGITVISSSAMMILANSLSGTSFQEGSISYEIAQSGIQNALLRLLRDPSYTGETLPVGNGSAVITVTSSGANSYRILSKGIKGNFIRIIQADVTYDNNTLQITAQKEVQ